MLHVISTGLFASTALAGVIPRSAPLWQPMVGSKYQIVITNNVSVDTNQPLVPDNTPIWDIDLINTPKEIFDGLHAQGKKIICYFSAGTSENWRPDYHLFKSADIGAALPEWPGENWLNVRSADVWTIMKNRIKMAAEKGCDGIDPDNMDAYGNGGGGYGLTQSDAKTYIRKLAAEAATYGMSTGLKNADEILNNVSDVVQFAVNEECAVYEGCSAYDTFLRSGKPVFHIEYAKHSESNGETILSSSDSSLAGKSSEQLRKMFCANAATVADGEAAGRFSTVIKNLNLDGWVYYCDKSVSTTPTMKVGTGGPIIPTSRGGRKSKGAMMAKSGKAGRGD